jgi:hypothetical protein
MAELSQVNELHFGSGGEEYVTIMMQVALDMAYYRAYKPTPCQIEPHPDVPKHLHIMSVTSWLEEMFGHQNISNEIKAWSDHRWVNFTHFIRLAHRYHQDYPITHVTLATAWARQCACLGDVNQATWDIIVPAYESQAMPALHDDLLVRKLCFIVIQVKNRRYHSPTAAERLSDLAAGSLNSNNAPGPNLSVYLSLDAVKAPHFECKQLEDGSVTMYAAGAGTTTYAAMYGLEPGAEKQAGQLLGRLPRDATPDTTLMDSYDIAFSNHTFGCG